VWQILNAEVYIDLFISFFSISARDVSGRISLPYKLHLLTEGADLTVFWRQLFTVGQVRKSDTNTKVKWATVNGITYLFICF
jgi:hypothetical protein